MKRLRPDIRLLRAVYGFAGLVFGCAMANATVVYFNNFEGAEANAVAAGAGTGSVATLYSYGNQGGWNQVRIGGTGNTSWWYSTKYATAGGGTGRPDPLGPASAPYNTNGQGSTALHGLNASGFNYTYRVLATAFVPGDTYRFSVSAATDNGLAGQAVFLYFFKGSSTPTLSFDTQSSAAAEFDSIGTTSTVNNAGGTVSNLIGGVFDSVNNAGNWKTVSFDFTPNASMAGENIGIGIYMRSQTAVDNIQVEQFAAVPEPGSLALTAVAGMLFSRRRRKA